MAKGSPSLLIAHLMRGQNAGGWRPVGSILASRFIETVVRRQGVPVVKLRRSWERL